MNLQNKIMMFLAFVICLLGLLPVTSKYLNNLGISKKFERFLLRFQNNYSKGLLVIIMIVAAAVRLWKFGIIPAGINCDEAMGAVDALAIAQHGTDRFGMTFPVHFTAWGFGQMSVLLSYISVPFIGLFGLNNITTRIAVAIVSLLALYIIYSLCKLMLNQRVALVVLAFCAINPWQIMQSRWALDCNMLPHFFLFSIYFLCLGIKKNKKYLYISMLFFGISMYAYGIAWFILPIFLTIISVYLIVKKHINPKELALAALSYLVIAWPIFGVMIVNTFKFSTIETPLFTIPFFTKTVRTGDILFFSQTILKQISNNFTSFVNISIFQTPDLPWNSIPEYGTLYPFSIVFTILGLFILGQNLKNKNTKSRTYIEGEQYFSFLIIAWLFIAFMVGLIINGVNVNRINILFYPLIIFAGIGIYWVIHRVKIFAVVILLVYIVGFSGFSTSYFGEHSNVLAQTFYNGFGDAMEYVKDIDSDTIYVTNCTQGLNTPWISETLTLYYQQIDALYFQGNADIYSKAGKKLLSYKDRYKFVQFNNFIINPDEKAVYIVNNFEIEKFDMNKFKVVRFAYYSAIIPNHSK